MVAFKQSDYISSAAENGTSVSVIRENLNALKFNKPFGQLYWLSIVVDFGGISVWMLPIEETNRINEFYMFSGCNT